MSEKYLDDNGTQILINQIKENCTQKRSTLPIASIDELGNTYQYTGTTSGSLVYGYFYECVSDGQDPATYSWQRVNTQPTAETPTAATTTFDNTTSGLQATNVQEAIDEVEGRVDNIEDKVPSTATSSNKLIDHDSLGTAAFKDSTDRVSPNNTALVESQSVYSAINTALSSIYTPRGDITCAELTSDLLIAANVGNIYETSDSGTTSALFLQGAGVSIPTGSNVGIINAGQGRILFNLMANAFDLTDYQKKDLTQAVEGATTVEGALGALSSNKADKVSSATNGDIATLDANGNLVDSGKKPSDFINNYNYSMTGTSDAEADIKSLVDTLDNLADNGTYSGQFIRRGYAAGTYTASMFKDSYHKYVEGVVTSASNDFTVVKDTLLSTGVSTYYIKELSVYKYLGGARGEGTSGGTTIGDIHGTWTFLIPSSKIDVNTNYFTYDSTTGNFTAKKAGKYKVTFYLRYSDTTSSSLCSSNNSVALSIYKGSKGKYHEFGGSDWILLDAHSSGNARLSQLTEWVIDCSVNETISVGGYSDNTINDASCWAYYLNIEKVG